MKVRKATAIRLGVIAAVVMTLVMVAVRAAGLSQMNLEMMNGAMITRSVDTLTWVLGLAMHLVAGAVFGLVYAAIFEAWGRAGWQRGLLLGALHSLLSGTLLAVMPFIHPAIPEHSGLPAPGFLAAGYGPVTVVGFVVLHLLFGVIVGAGYRVRGAARVVVSRGR